jgi:hypothetical protein
MTQQLSNLDKIKNNIELQKIFNALIVCNNCRFHNNCKIEKELSFIEDCNSKFCSYGRK